MSLQVSNKAVNAANNSFTLSNAANNTAFGSNVTTIGTGQLIGSGSFVGGPLDSDTEDYYLDGDDSGLRQRINRRKLVELQLTDGTKILKVLRFRDLIDVREVKETDNDGNEVPVVKFDYYVDSKQLKTYSVACDLQAFAKLFGLTYESFAAVVVQSAVENG